MIYVTPLASRGRSWRAGASAKLFSDAGLEELHEFAERIGLRPHRDFVKGPLAYYDVGPGKRAAAVAAGARAVYGGQISSFMSLARGVARIRDREARQRYAAWLAAGPGRGPFPGSQA